jgi:toxin YoeB
MRELKWEPEAVVDLKYWKSTDLKKYQKILTLCKQICVCPVSGIGQPEPLKHKWSGCWSRRIDQQHRLIYRFDEETVYIIQARYHY